MCRLAGIPVPLLAHRTGLADFPHLALRLDTWQAHGRLGFAFAIEAQHAEFPVDMSVRERFVAMPADLVPPREEDTDAFSDVMIDSLVGLLQRSVGEVTRPATQYCVEPVAHIVPGAGIYSHQNVAHFVLQTSDALLRRARTRIRSTILPPLLPRQPMRVSSITVFEGGALMA